MDGSSCNTRTNDTNIERADGVDLYVDKLRFKTSVHPEESNIHPCESDRRWRPARDAAERFSGSFDGPNGATLYVEIVDLMRHPQVVPQKVTVEFNPSHYVFGSESRNGVRVQDIPKVLASLKDWVRPKLFELGDLQFAELQRLDLAADFELHGVAPEIIIGSLEKVPRSRRLTVTTRRNAGAATLYIEPGLKKANSGRAWKFRVYSKEELGGDDDRLRAELELRGRVLKELDMKYVGDIETFDAIDAFQTYWERSELGVPIVSNSRLWTALSDEARRSGRLQREVGNAFGYVFARDVAGTSSMYSPGLRRKHERFLADAGCEAINWQTSVSGHLDLATLSFIQTTDD